MLRRPEVGLLCILVICLLCVVPWWSACSDRKHHSGTRLRLFASTSEQSPTTPDGPYHQFAYVLYATSENYLCSAVINSVRLKDLNVTVAADIVVIIDQAWLERSNTAVARRLRVLRALDVGISQSILLQLILNSILKVPYQILTCWGLLLGSRALLSQWVPTCR